MKGLFFLILLLPFSSLAQDTLYVQLSQTEETMVFRDLHDKVILFSGQLKSISSGNEIKPLAKVYAHRWPRNRSHILLENCSHIVLEGIAIRGPNKDGGTDDKAYHLKLEAQHGLQIENCRQIVVKNAEISHVFGDIVYIRNSEDIEITRLTGHHNGRQGMAIVNSKKIFFHKNHFYQIRRAHIDLENNQRDELIEQIYIYNNRFGPSRLKWIASAGMGTVRLIYVMNNDLYDKDFDIYVGREDGRSAQSYWYIMNNISLNSRGNPQRAITKFFHCDHIYMAGNSVRGQNLRKMNIMGVHGGDNFFLGENEVVNGSNKIVKF